VLARAAVARPGSGGMATTQSVNHSLGANRDRCIPGARGVTRTAHGACWIALSVTSPSSRDESTGAPPTTTRSALDILGDQLKWVCPQQPAHNSHRRPRLRKQARPGREHGASSRESCVDTQAPLAKRHGNPVHEQECLVQCGGAACGIGEHLDVVGQLLECGDDAGSDRPRPRRTIDQDSGTGSG
jgi:hypothetical protein